VRGSGLAAAVSQMNSGHIKGGWIMAEFPKTEEGIIQLSARCGGHRGKQDKTWIRF
jgi:hypothetical protein